MSWAVWITGPPGSGKTTVARAVVTALRAHGWRPVVLELDALRPYLAPEATYSPAEREFVYRSLVAVAAALVDAGVPVLIDATGHRRAWRDLARSRLPGFIEVQLRCPLSLCQARERRRPVGHAPVGIYARAGRPGATVPGVDVPYEEALAPELVVDTEVEAPDSAAARVVRLITLRFRTPGAPPAGPGWVLWITGMPGSGKTTLAARAVDVLGRRGLWARHLSWADFCAGLSTGLRVEAEQETFHRALVVAAMLLAGTGVRVIVDATAPRRRWREMARRLIPRFAEVQLRCPRPVSAERESRQRWATPVPGSPAVPDVVLHYEESVAPELVLDTGSRSVEACVEEVVRLAWRLERSEAAAVDAALGRE
ncbi:MAG TPA: adenylyl-sulfate kinase [Calidithermus sp.]|nr:adenylyl-sulfate kinase [Calidithermus sp.]